MIKKLEKKFNVFGNYTEIMKEMIAEMSPEEQKRLSILMSFAAMELGHANISGYTDERNKASKIFASLNLSYFKNEIEKEMGFLPEINEEAIARGYSYGRSITNIKEIKDAGYEWIIQFLYEWKNVHPTIQQAVFGGWVKGVLLEKENAELIPNNGSYYSFPFI